MISFIYISFYNIKGVPVPSATRLVFYVARADKGGKANTIMLGESYTYTNRFIKPLSKLQSFENSPIVTF